jgi:O-antigen ligase
MRRLSEWAFLGGVAVSAWIGVGLAVLTTGKELGTGLQPAYLLLGISGIAALIGEPDFRRRLVSNEIMARWMWLGGLTILLSGLGLWIANSGVPFSDTGSKFLKQCLQWLMMAAIALLTAHRLLAERCPSRFLGALAVGVGIQGMYGLLQVWQFPTPADWFVTFERVATSNPAILSGSEELYLGHAFTGIPRVRGTACEPLYLGNLLLGAIPFFLARSAQDKRWLSFAGLGMVVLLVTWSRGAWLGGVAAGVVAGAMLWTAGIRPGQKTVLITLGLTALGLTVVTILVGPDSFSLVFDRLRQSMVKEDWSNLTRLYSMQAAWRAFLLSPWLGIGWGQFGYHFHLLTDPAGLQSQFDWPVVNNLPLQILAECGMVGFAGFLLAVIFMARRIIAKLQELGGTPALFWLVAATAAVIGQWTQLLTFSQYNLPHIWISLGALMAASTPGRKSSS